MGSPIRASSLLLLVTALANMCLLAAACGGDAEPAANQLAYIDADGNIKLVNTDGSSARKLADASTCGRFPRLVWSPTGQRLACIGTGTNDEGVIVLMDAEGETMKVLKVPGGGSGLYWSSNGHAFLYYSVGGLLFLADDSGRTLADLGPVELVPGAAQPYRGLKFWSPDGRQFAYRPAGATELRIYSLDSMTERSLAGDYRPMAWAFGGKVPLVAMKYQPPVNQGYPSYEVSLLDLASGALTRVPELDNGRQLWLSPDGTRAAVLTRGTAGSDGYPGLAVLTFPSQEFKPIPDSVITFSGDHIPEEWVTFAADESQIYWITEWESGAAVFEAHSDGSGLTKRAQVDARSAEFSPDLTMIAYRVFDQGTNILTLYTANLDGSGVHEIDRADIGSGGFGPAPAWRPTP